MGTKFDPTSSPPPIQKKNTRDFQFLDHDDDLSLPIFPFSTILNECDAELINEPPFPLPSFTLDDANARCRPGEKRSRNNKSIGHALKVRRRLCYQFDHQISPTTATKSPPAG